MIGMTGGSIFVHSVTQNAPRWSKIIHTSRKSLFFRPSNRNSLTTPVIPLTGALTNTPVDRHSDWSADQAGSGHRVSGILAEWMG